MNEKMPFVIVFDKRHFLLEEPMGIACFLSEESLSLHKEYLCALRTKRKLEENASQARLLDEQILAHELFFSSFRKERVRCERIRKGYGSENRFCFALKEYAETGGTDFLYIFPIGRYPYVGFGREAHLLKRAVLAIDLFEHAYFLDYGFDFPSYLQAALAHLDFSRLDVNAEKEM